MFTGIIEGIGIVVSVEPGELTIEVPGAMADLTQGESIAVDGVDLTVATFEGRVFTANAMPETYRRSTLGGYGPHRRVNLERAVLPTTRLSGHLVRGVVEGTARLEGVSTDANALICRLSAERDLLDHIVIKGPVALDGASLTVIDRDADGFAVSVVGYSQTHTTVSERRLGDPVNVETDILARYVNAAVVRLLADR